jgi:hypothetical protein
MTTADRKARLLLRKSQIEAQLADLEARANLKRRKAETRGKIIAGANALDVAKRKLGFRAELADHMNRTVTRPEDRAMFDFLPENGTPAASDGFAEAANPARTLACGMQGGEAPVAT